MNALEGEFRGAIGSVVSRIRRVVYEFKGEVTTDSGPLEITLASDLIWIFDAGPDGETLHLSKGPWSDPFIGQVSAENRKYVDDHGKWTAREVSALPPFSSLVGRALTGYQLVRSPRGLVTGVVLEVDGVSARIAADSDELHVDISGD